jgi:aconitase A
VHRQLRAPVDEPIAQAIEEETSWSPPRSSRATATIEGRHPPLARASYLASPPLVVAFALAGASTST